MTLNLNGTSGVSGVDGSASTPSYQGSSSATTGVFFSGSAIGLSTGGTERVRFDSTGNMIFSTTGQRIQGDFDNATINSRTSFQTKTTNASTGVYFLPNGTSTASSVQVANNSDPTNASKILLATNASTDVQLVSGVNGSGTYLPLTFYNNGSEQMRLTTAGNFGIGVTAPATSLALRAGTASVAPLGFTSGTNLTSALAGAIEWDGRVPYMTPQSTERGALLAPQYYEVYNTAITGPTIANTGQTATITIAAPAVITVTTAPNNGTIVTFTTTGALPTGLTVGVQYFVINQTATTFQVSLTRGGTAITTTGTQSGTQTATFHSSIFNVGCNLSANTRYAYEIYTSAAKTSANAATIQYSITQATGTLSSHAYEVLSNTAAASTTVAATSQMANYITTGFLTPVSITAASAAAASAHTILIKGIIDVSTASTNVNFNLGFNAAPTTSTFIQGSYILIYPISVANASTSVGTWA
jgi:hypothetical protein